MQKDVVAESAEILKLGLLFGEDIQATTEDLPAVLSFQHKLIQEYLAAIYIAESVKLDTTSTFLTEAFQTWEKIENHKEVVQFACGILADTDARPITYYVAKVLARHTHNQLNTGVRPSFLDLNSMTIAMLRSFEKEGKVSLEINPYLCEYPACGRPLAEVLANTELAYITDIDKNDTLQLNPSPTQIIVELSRVDSEWFDRLWLAFNQIHAGIIVFYLGGIRSANVTKLSHFCQLKSLSVVGNTEAVGEHLAESINAWGPQPHLTSCKLEFVSMPTSLLAGLSKCTHLMHLDLFACDLHENFSIFMSSPPPKLKYLRLPECSLQGTDVDLITQAIREGHLTSLQWLFLQYNPVGETAMGGLMEALVSTRPNKELTIRVRETGVDEDEGDIEWSYDTNLYPGLSQQFKSEWRVKLTGTNINVQWD